jgi:RNA polymerase sigma factor (sigma-70 family)
MPHQPDTELIKEIIAGSTPALHSLYKAHFQAVYHYVFNNNGTEQEAKDVYQEAVIIFYEKITTESFTLSCSIGTYLFAVAKRLWLKRLTEKRKHIGSIPEFDMDIPEEDLVSHTETDYQKMHQALQTIGNPCKNILEAYYINNQNMASIAEEFGYTNPDNAKNQKYKCLVRLKKLFFQTEA